MNQMIYTCYVCLLEPSEPGPSGRIDYHEAVTLVNGTAVCGRHLRHIANANVLAVGREDFA